MLQLHRLPEDEKNNLNANLPEMEHCSQVKMRAACNCGRKQFDRDDPFDYKVFHQPFLCIVSIEYCIYISTDGQL
jgi:protein SMG8